jgi:molecular chaperone HtpG
LGYRQENIFPIIKKFLYNDHEIFLREVIANATDATQKLKTLASVGEFNGELGDLAIRVSVDPKKKIITVSDRGVGMTAEEIDQYINQIAFSSAEVFMEKYKQDANSIIGHFGMGFYSTFMVSKRVDIVTKSWQEGAQAYRWSCDGSPEYTLEPTDKSDRGTDIIMYLDEENKEFAEEKRISDLLHKYCQFMPIPIVFGKKKTWKDGKEVETEEDNQINNTNPAWTRNRQS